MNKAITIFLLFISVISCKNEVKTTKKENPVVSSERKDATQEKDHHGENEETITLNNGEKWQANPETTSGIKNMQEIVNAFSKNTSLEDYQAFKTKLEAEFTTIFQKCTMKGEAHEQLHNYLKPMIPIFDGLVSNQTETRQDNLNKLKKHLTTYSTYFN